MISWFKIGLIIATAVYSSNLPPEEDCLHPWSETNLGIYETEYGRESYYYCMPYVIENMYEFGYDKDEYPYWVREDGVQMFGDYVVVAADFTKYTYGDIIETSLGTGMVCDIGGFADWDYIDIGTLWR